MNIKIKTLRRVIALHLGIPERAEWTACITDATEETNATKKLARKFEPYNWTKTG